MNHKVVAVLVVGAVAAGTYLGDQFRVGVARATLQNRVSLVAGEARDDLEHSAALTLHLTCGEEDKEEVRSVDLELPASQVTKARLMSQVPVDCKLTNVQLNAVHLMNSARKQVALESPQFHDGVAEVTVAQTRNGVEITATGTATAGWFKRKIQASARVMVDDAEQRQAVQQKVLAALAGTGAEVAVVTPPSTDETESEVGSTEESKKSTQGSTNNQQSGVTKPSSGSKNTGGTSSSSKPRPQPGTPPTSGSGSSGSKPQPKPSPTEPPSNDGGSDEDGSDQGSGNPSGSNPGGSDQGSGNPSDSNPGGSDEGSGGQSGSDQGGSDGGGSDEGSDGQSGSDQGGSDEGGPDEGSGDESGSDQGGSDQGGSDEGAGDSGSEEPAP